MDIKRTVPWVFAVILAGAGAVAFGDPGPGQNYVGINVGSVFDWEGNIIFADAMKQARPWGTVASNGNDALPASSLDAHGWPVDDAAVVVWAGLLRDNSGAYALSFESNSGAVFVSLFLTNGSVSNQVFDPVAHVTTAQVVLTDPSSNVCGLRFTNTSGGVRSVKFMRPIAPGSATSQVFTDNFSVPFLSAIAPFHALRFMDYLSTYGNPQIHWSERVQPDYASFNRSPSNYSWLGTGGAWEYIILLCNQTKKDAWVDVPLYADDDYITQLATLFRDGDAFTGNAGLDPSVKLYIEYDNEVWNFDLNLDHALAVSEHANGDPYYYAGDGESNDWGWAWRRVARRAADISLIFRKVFGDARMMTQIRPVLEWQQANGQGTGSEGLIYTESLYIPHFAPGKTVNYLFYGGGGSAYYYPDNNSDSLDPTGIWTTGTMNPLVFGPESLQADMHLCAAFGLKRLAYEGGPSFDNTGHSESVKAQAWASAEMGTEITAQHNVWSQWGGDLLLYYTLRPNDYQWGFSHAINDLTLPKYVAAAALAGAPRAAAAHGNPPSVSVPGQSYDLKNWSANTSWMGSVVDFSNGDWVHYLFNIPMDGVYEVQVANHRTGSGGSVDLLTDGVFTSSWTASATSQTQTQLVNLTKGLHSVRLRAPGAQVEVASVLLSPSGITDSQPPTAPGTPTTVLVTSTTVQMSWAPATDNTGVAKYWIYRNGVLVDTETTTSFTDFGLTPSTAYSYAVRAVDIFGNQGPLSPATPVTTSNATSGGTGGGTGGGTTASSVTLLETAAFPNPAVGKDPTIRAFVGNADELEITIYDAAGSVVHSDRFVGGPTGTASNGQPYYDYVWTGKKASGVYYAVIHGKKGGDVVRARAKFAIVK